MSARSISRLSSVAINLQLLLLLVTIFPEFLSEYVLFALLTLSILAAISIHPTALLLLLTAEQPVLYALWSMTYVSKRTQALFLIGIMIHMIIIQNQIASQVV